VSKTFRPYAPRQAFLLPPSPLEWLPEGHLALFILDVVQQLDLSAIYAHYERELRGYPPHDPQMMVALLLYGYCVGVPSSRKIERKTHEDVAFRVISGGGHPDHSRISDFRRVHLEALAGLFVEILRLCQKAGLVKLGSVALDGTKVKANASKHKAMSYERMKKDEQRLRGKVSELLAKAEQVDEEEDAVHGKGSGDELPEDLRHAKDRGERIRQLMKELEEETKRQQEEEKAAKGKDEPPPPPTGDSLPWHKIPTTADGEPTPKAQRNFTDPESRIMKSGDGFVQAYNCQAMVDDAYQIIVAEAVTNQPPDVEHLVPMIARTVENCGEKPTKLVADTGYFSEANVCEAIKWGIDPYIATGRRHHDDDKVIAPRGRAPSDLSIKELMARKLATKSGAAIYSRRKVIVEPVFGQVKEARGFRRFLLRGLKKVRGEWSLIALTHNLLKLHAYA
jgi:transposase